MTTLGGVTRHSAAGLGGATLASAALGAAAATGDFVIVGASVAVLLAAVVTFLLGRAIFPVALIVVVPLIPVVGNPPLSGASTARLALMVLLLSGGLLLRSQSNETLRSVPMRALIKTLLILGAVGTLIAVADESSVHQTLKALSLAAGQPVAYAGFLALFSLAIQNDVDNRERLLTAWAIAMVAEGVYVAAEFRSGSAFDAFRGYTRGQGTTGADFLGAFAAVSTFGAMALKAVATSRSARVLAWLAIFAAAGCLLVSLSRGSLIGLGVGLAYVVLRARSPGSVESRRPIALVLAIIIVLSGGLYAAKNLWLTRLSSHSVGTTSGRSATWASGLLIAVDHPITGVGPNNLVTVIDSNSRYNETAYGRTSSTPSDMWIFALAAGGILYGLAAIWATAKFVTIVRRSAPSRPPRETVYLEAALVVTLPILAINNIFTHPENMVIVMLAIALLVMPDKARTSSPKLAARRNSREVGTALSPARA